MFETHVEGEIPLPVQFDHPSVRAWSYVLCRLFVPWLHVVRRVTVEEDGEPYAVQETLFLAQVGQLLQAQAIPQAKIVAIDLMSPGHLNGTGHWKLEPLAEIWEGFVPMDHGNQRAFVYVLADGTRYVDSAFDTPESELVDKHRLIKMKPTGKSHRK